MGTVLPMLLAVISDRFLLITFCQYEVSMSSASNVETQAMFEAVRTNLAPSLLPHFHSYRDQLIQANAKDLGHDNDSSAGVSGTSTPTTGSKPNGSSGSAAAPTPEKKETKAAGTSSGLSTTKVEVEAELSIRREDLWDLLTNQARIPMWTRAPAQVSQRIVSYSTIYYLRF